MKSLLQSQLQARNLNHKSINLHTGLSVSNGIKKRKKRHNIPGKYCSTSRSCWKDDDALTIPGEMNLQARSFRNLVRDEFMAPIRGSSLCRKRFRLTKICKADCRNSRYTFVMGLLKAVWSLLNISSSRLIF